MTIELDGVHFEFSQAHGPPVRVLDSLSLRIDTGQVVTLVGPSGCGKSTILRLISGLLSADEGVIKVEGASPQDWRRRGGFGAIFQSPALLPWRNVRRNVSLALEARGSSFDSHRIDDALARVGLSEWANRQPYELSGGMQQRVALARALVGAPQVLLLDEPFSQLDELLRFELLFSVQDQVRDCGMTVVLVTHDVSEAVLSSDVVLVLSDRPVRNAEAFMVPLPRPRTLASAEDSRFTQVVASVRASLGRRRDNPRAPSQAARDGA